MMGFDLQAITQLPFALAWMDWGIIGFCVLVFLLLFRLSVWHVLVFFTLYAIALYLDLKQVYEVWSLSVQAWKWLAVWLPVGLGALLTYRWVHQVGFLSSLLVTPYLAVGLSLMVMYLLLGALASTQLALSNGWQMSILVPYFTQLIEQF
jgi:hypothetical protein